MLSHYVKEGDWNSTRANLSWFSHSFDSPHLKTTTLRRDPGVRNSFESCFQILVHISVCVCVFVHPTGAPSRVDAVSLLQMILWETRWQPGSAQLHMPHHHTHIQAHTRTRHVAAAGPRWVKHVGPRAKLPVHILSAQRKCQSACPSQLKRCVYVGKMYFLLAVLVLRDFWQQITLLLPGQFLYSSF